MRVSKSNESLQNKANNKELKEIDLFKYLGSMLRRDGYCTREMKMRIVIAKKLNNELREKLVMCYVWSSALYGSET